MGRSPPALAAVVAAIALAAWVKATSDSARASSSTPTPTTPDTASATPHPTPIPTPIANVSPATDEASLMARLRAADPAGALALAREGNRRYPGSPSVEERAAREIDALVALDRIGEAHAEAMDFVQEHPAGPYSAHVMNLMGVHPRPRGAVPVTPAAAAAEGR